MATGANSTPLGRLNPAFVQTKSLVAASALPHHGGIHSGHGGIHGGPGPGPGPGPGGPGGPGGLGGPGGAGPGGLGSLLKPHYMQSLSYHHPKRELEDDSSNSSWSSDGGRRKKKRSRWGGDEKDKTFIPGMPTVIPANLSKDQEKAYLLQLQIEEVSRRLRTGDLGIPPNPEERSPSPEPIYNNEGKRLNTREYRTRKKLEDERHHLIQLMYDVNTDYKPPADYKPPVIRVSDKVMIPQEEHPDINFVGLLIGPRGNTLKAMEKETGAKIIIRGKGSVKEGKVGRKDGQPLPGEDEPLHAYVTANNPESVKKAVEKIKEIIRQGVEVPEGQNDLRRMQLRELALLNGTLRENDGPRCSNCGATTHKSWQCPDKPNVTNNVICTNCGGAGHIAKDCRERRPGNVFQGVGNNVDKAKIDEEYMSLMAELGEGPPPPTKNSGGMAPMSLGPGPLSTPQGPPRAIMAPTSMSQQSQQQSQTQQPPALMSQTLVPPWMNTNSQPPKPPSLMNLSTMPPPSQQQQSHNLGPPGVPMSLSSNQSQQALPPWQQQNQSPMAMGMMGANSYGGVPPPVMLSQPPPPPPSGQPPTTRGMSWMQQSPPGMSQPPWQHMGGIPPPPGPVPPPRMGSMPPPGSNMPWHQGFMGVPPPPVQSLGSGVPPPPPGQMGQQNASNSNTSASNMDLNALVLPNLLAAPPPPPPS